MSQSCLDCKHGNFVDLGSELGQCLYEIPKIPISVNFFLSDPRKTNFSLQGHLVQLSVSPRHGVGCPTWGGK